MYGNHPISLGKFNIKDRLGAYLLYLPIKINSSDIRLPDGYEELFPLVKKCLEDYKEFKGRECRYIYLSFETSEVKKGITQKRPGWHSDGFLTDDVNYIWCSDFPTTYSTANFNITPDHSIAIEEMNSQALPEFDNKIKNKTLVRMDQFVIHKATEPEKDGIRTFVKLSFSDDQYNLKGNSYNDKFHYEWKMYDRKMVRNHPQQKEVDSFKED